MRNVSLILLLAMVPYLTMAQKRSKKNKNKENSVEFLLIKGIESFGPKEMLVKVTDKESYYSNLKAISKMNIDISYVFSEYESKENKDLIKKEKGFLSMADAVNAATDKGWTFHSSNIVNIDNYLIHYYYLQRGR